MHPYNPRDHYWKRSDGTVFSSSRNTAVGGDDPEYRKWLSRGHIPTAYPKDGEGIESEAALDAVLAPHGLRASRQRARDLREAAYRRDADAHRDRALSYQTEAKGWQQAGNAEKALAAERKASAALEAYLAAKEEIRRRFPDETAAAT